MRAPPPLPWSSSAFPLPSCWASTSCNGDAVPQHLQQRGLVHGVYRRRILRRDRVDASAPVRPAPCALVPDWTDAGILRGILGGPIAGGIRQGSGERGDRLLGCH